jgi:hypothetical protein
MKNYFQIITASAMNQLSWPESSISAFFRLNPIESHDICRYILWNVSFHLFQYVKDFFYMHKGQAMALQMSA